MRVAGLCRTLAGLAAVSALGWACTEAPPEPSPEARAEEAAVAQSLAAPVQLAEGEGLEVRLVWENIAVLHQGFFSDAGAVEKLGRGLSTAMQGPATVRVAYDDQERQGTLRLELVPTSLRSPVRAGAEGVELLALRPLAMPLARYRDAIADRYDVRVRNFNVEIQLTGANVCRVGLAGPMPPDGSVLSPCLMLGVERVCGEVEGALVRFPTRASEIAGCFRP